MNIDHTPQVNRVQNARKSRKRVALAYGWRKDVTSITQLFLETGRDVSETLAQSAAARVSQRSEAFIHSLELTRGAGQLIDDVVQLFPFLGHDRG